MDSRNFSPTSWPWSSFRWSSRSGPRPSGSSSRTGSSRQSPSNQLRGSGTGWQHSVRGSKPPIKSFLWTQVETSPNKAASVIDGSIRRFASSFNNLHNSSFGILTVLLDNCLRRNLSFFATALVCEGIEDETSHTLLTWPTAKQSLDWLQHFQTCSGGHHKQKNDNLRLAKHSTYNLG